MTATDRRFPIVVLDATCSSATARSPRCTACRCRSRSGEVVCLIGPSGSGKSTLLRCTNGLETIDGGESCSTACRCPRNETRHARVVRRRMGMVFQNFELFPHMTAHRERRDRAASPCSACRRAEARAPRRRAAGQGRPRGQGRRPSRQLSPAASSSASRSPARWPCSPRSCCSTSPPPRSIPKRSARC